MSNAPAQELWARVLAELAREVEPELIARWLADLDLAEAADGALVLLVPDDTRARLIEDHYLPRLRAAFREVTGAEPQLLLEVRTENAPAGEERSGRNGAAADWPYNPAFLLASFAEGQSNRLALAACRAVLSQPGRLYNPLFIHGPAGTGKTHLLQAMCREAAPARRTLYLRAADMDSVLGVADGSSLDSTCLAECDFLAIDDVQAMGDLPECQEALFHHFNALHSRATQMIFAANGHPNSLPRLSARLSSRFSWGLVVEIEPPLPDTTIQILSQKARERGIDAPRELLEELAAAGAGSGMGDIRVLEGLLARTAAGLSLFGAPADRDTIRRIISSLPGSTRPDRIVSTETIQQAVAAAYNLKTSELLGPSRSRSVATARHVAMFLARRMTNLQIQEIGGHFGGRDHSSVIYAIKKISKEVVKDQRLARLIDKIEKALSSAERP